MSTKPLYKKTLSRDFTLMMIEIWWRGETINPKIWTKEKQPYLPYIVFEDIGPTVNSYYDHRGIKWIENLLLDKAQQTDSFLFVEAPFREKYKKLKPICDKKPTLSRQKLIQFLNQCEDIWVWFEALWWIWESTLAKERFSDSFTNLMKLREESQNFVPYTEVIIKKSLKKLYPELGDLTRVLRLKEIADNNIPSINVLRKRNEGYFFVNKKLYVGKSRASIEKMLNIKLEQKTSDKNVKIIKGNTAFKGVVRGCVKVLYGTSEMNKVNVGDIIVAPMTLPDLLSAMKKAVAFITDEGGISCHAAIIAREMKKPCIVGTKIATQVLKDGDLVEVDADNGIVKIIKK